jgi:hypothetical protein
MYTELTISSKFFSCVYFYVCSYWTHLQDQGWQVVHLSATRYLSITIFQFSLVSFEMAVLCVVYHLVLIIVCIYVLAVI